MLSLSKIYLYNWHRFKDHLLEVEDGLFLTGHNGSGKSTVLDALQLVLIADLQKMRFNSSAQERSIRNLDSYVRGKIGEDFYLRKGNAVSYVALEFSSSTGHYVTVGACIEAGPERHAERSWFIQKSALETSLFFTEKIPLTRKELRARLRKSGLGETYDQVSEYQPALLRALGGIGENFFDLFMRALTFQPLRDVRAFVEQWLLQKASLDLENLRGVSDRLADLGNHCRLMQQQIAELTQIEEVQSEALRLHNLYQDYSVVGQLAEQEHLAEKTKQTQQNLESIRAAILEYQTLADTAQSSLERLTAEELELQIALSTSETGKRKISLERELTRLQELVNRFEKERANFEKNFESFQKSLTEQQNHPTSALVRKLLESDEPDPLELRHLRDAHLEELTLKKHALKNVLNEVAATEKQLSNLRQGIKTRPPYQAEQLRQILTTELGCDCSFLYETLEVREERWQSAAEAMLGQRRFLLVVPDEYFDRATDILEYQRRYKGLTDAALLNLAGVQEEFGRRANSARTETTAQSLAAIVHSDNLAVRSYLRFVLGDVQRVESVRDLKKFRKAITPDCVVHSEFTIRAIPKNRFEPWFIGVRAERSQTESLKEKGLKLALEVQSLNSEIERLSAELAIFECEDLIAKKKHIHFLTKENAQSQAEIASCEKELALLDLASLEHVQSALSQVQANIKELRKQERTALEALARSSVSLSVAEKTLEDNKLNALKANTAIAEFAKDKPELFVRGFNLFEEKKKTTDVQVLLRNAESTSRSYETRRNNETQKLIERATAYNIRHQFSANPSNLNEQRYTTEKQRLTATALPEFREKIEAEQKRAEQELREHVLHRLRERIMGARSQLEAVNRSLKDLHFNGESYKFRWFAADDLREFYELIVDARQLGNGSLLESKWYIEHKQSFDRFYEMLTSVPQTEQERKELERLTDYRSYLNYDIDVTHADGQISRLSRILGQTSGGETQTPFYITIAASFVQLYGAREKLGFECPRLICFDEAFSKMDQERIASTLEVFHKFNLQVVTATPLERCEYIVPQMKTCLVMTGVGHGVVVEPYRNYIASLETLAIDLAAEENKEQELEENVDFDSHKNQEQQLFRELE